MPIFEFKGPDGQTHSIEGPEGATQEQAFQMLQKQLGGQPAPAAPQEGFLSDTAKSVGSGLEQGAATAIGLPGDVATLAHGLAGMYTSPRTLSDLITGAEPKRPIIDAVKAIPGAQWLYNHLPTKQAVLDSATDPLVDPNYEPQYGVNRYTKRIASNAGPGLAGGMGVAGVLGSSVLGQGVQDATGSETAGNIAELAGGLGVPLLKAAIARRAIQPLMDAKAVKDIANNQYAEPLIRDTAVSPQAAERVASDMSGAMNNARSRFTAANAPAVHEAIDNLGATGARSGVGPPAPVTIEDLHLLRKDLGKLGQETRDFKPTEQAVAAGQAKRVLDQYLDNVPSADVVRGDPIDAVDRLRTANANWRAQSNAQKVDNLIGNAIVDNDSAHSAMNLGNKIRQTFKPLLKNDAAKLRAMGYGDEVIDPVREITAGDKLTNALRYGSNMLGGGGGIASTIIGHGISSAAGGGLGYEEGGVPGMILGTALGAVPGQALRLAANRRTLAAAQRVQQQILATAPANQAIVKVNNAIKAANSYKGAIQQNALPLGNMLLSRLLNGGS